MDRWDDEQYLKFGNERTRPARELLARVPLAAPRFVVDLGCGPGNSTALLRDRWPDARVIGVDSSREMLDRARADAPETEWLLGDARTFVPTKPLDLLFANAILQWLPDHQALMSTWVMHLQRGGALAVQMPFNFDESSHRLMRELAPAEVTATTNVRRHSPVSPPSVYYDLLAPLTTSVDIWETRYEHVMPSAEAIVEWVKGTGLRPYLDAIAPHARPAFLDAYTHAIDAAYPPRADGKRLFSFPRLFIVAVR